MVLRNPPLPAGDMSESTAGRTRGRLRGRGLKSTTDIWSPELPGKGGGCLGMALKAMGPGVQRQEAGRPGGPAWDLQTLLWASQREPSGAWGLAEQTQRPRSPEESGGRAVSAPLVASPAASYAQGSPGCTLPAPVRLRWLLSRLSPSSRTQGPGPGQGQGRPPSWGPRLCPRPVLGMEQEGDGHWGEPRPGAPSPARRTSDVQP